MSNKPIAFKIIYNRKNKLDENGTALIQIEAYKDAKRFFVSTGIYITPEQWDKDKERINSKHLQNTKLNLRIKQTIADLQNIEQKHSYNNQSFSINELKNLWENKSVQGFISFMENRLPKEKNLSPGTIVKTKRTINKFKDYAKGEAYFHNLNFAVLNGFNDYLIADKIAANTRKNEFKFLSKYANLAVNEGLLEYAKNPFKDFKITKEATHREALNELQLKKIEALTFTKENKHLEQIRDLFLLQCYTGLRFGDASRLCKEHIHETPEGLEIRMQAEKTRKAMYCPLGLLFKEPGASETKPEKLIKKYWREDNLPFFLSHRSQQKEAVNNQYTNRELKTIQALAEVKTVLKTHIGRHTFATFLVWRVPLPVVQELLQHSKVETTMIYVTVGSERVKEQLKKVTDWF